MDEYKNEMVVLVKCMRDGGRAMSQWGNAYTDEDFRVQLWTEDITLLKHLGVDAGMLDKTQERYNPDDANKGYTVFEQPIEVILSAVKARRIDTDATRAHHGIDRAGKPVDAKTEAV